MGETPDSEIPEKITSRVRDEPVEYVERDQFLEKHYFYGNETESEPIKAIQKEIDGMARFFCLLSSKDDVQIPTSHLLEIYDQEVEHLRALEEQVVEELPERRR